MKKVLETLVKDSGGSPKLEQVKKAAKVGLDFLESYSRAPATDYRRQVKLGQKGKKIYATKKGNTMPCQMPNNE